MVTRDGKQLARENSVARKSAKPQARHKVSPLRQRMIGDMELAGYTQGTQRRYIGAVVKLQDHYHVRPDRLSEKQVQQYSFWLRNEKKVANLSSEVLAILADFLFQPRDRLPTSIPYLPDPPSL